MFVAYVPEKEPKDAAGANFNSIAAKDVSRKIGRIIKLCAN